MSPAPLILASASPRRRQLLSQIGIRFRLAPQHIDETRRAGETPETFALRMSREKAVAALTASALDNGAVVLASDTVVVCDDEVLGKPKHKADGLRMLNLLSDREHRVLTAVTVATATREQSLMVDSRVRFRQIDRPEAERYWDTGEPVDKAGAYAIQGRAAVFVKSLSGSYSGVMGLPLFETAQLLDAFGIECWQEETE